MKLNILWKKEDKLALALSTGVDSVVLLDLLVTKYKDSYQELVIYHVNHGLRTESDEEEVFAESLAQKHNLKIYKKSLNLKDKKEKGLSEEMLAREARYSAFEEFAREIGVSKILTGHHKNDNVENIFIRILSQRAIDHKIHIEEKSKIKNLDILRPMLDISKKEIEVYAQNNKLEYRQDESNFDTKYTRNYLRQNIVPHFKEINDKAEDNTLVFANHYQKLQEYAKKVFLEKLEALGLDIYENEVKIGLEDFEKLEDIEKYFYISYVLNEKLNVFGVGSSVIDKTIAILEEKSKNFSLDLKQDVKIIKEYQSLTICKNQKKCYNDKIAINFSAKEDVIYDFNDYKIIVSKENRGAEVGFMAEDFPLIARVKIDGDRIKRGLINKKIARLFIDYKIPKEERERLPLLVNFKQEVVAVLGLNARVSQNKKYDYYIKLLKG